MKANILDTRVQSMALPMSLLGLPVNSLNKDDLVNLVSEAIATQRRYIIGNHNLHSVYVSQRESRMRDFYHRADFVHVDGMSLVLIGRMLGLPLERKHRTGYMDLLPSLFERASEKCWKVFYLGSKPGVAARAAAILEKKYPNLQMRVRHGYFNIADPEQNSLVLSEIAAFEPNLLLIGMGMPRQEIWILDNLASIRANAVFCCGALMDYVAGEIPTPPRWLGQIGLEWLYRLVAEPQRLWKRYLVEPWSVAVVLAREIALGKSRIESRRQHSWPQMRNQIRQTEVDHD